MTRRERWDQLPLQAHFYPMPSMAFIEDTTARITLATRQPLGVASLESGQLEVVTTSCVYCHGRINFENIYIIYR